MHKLQNEWSAQPLSASFLLYVTGRVGLLMITLLAAAVLLGIPSPARRYTRRSRDLEAAPNPQLVRDQQARPAFVASGFTASPRP